jgi:peroxiredoxin Q/BCP
LSEFDIAYFMASVDDAETNKKFAAEHGGAFAILSDPQKTTAKAYGVLRADQPIENAFAARFTFYIGPDGKILDIDKGPTGRGVGVRTAGEDTVKKLQALGVKKKK